MSHGRFQLEPQRAPFCAPVDVLSDAAAESHSERPVVFGRIGLCRTAADWHAQGVRQETAGETAAAIDSYTKALLVGGPDVQIVFDLAYALAAAGHTERAIERYRQVLELDPRRGDAWVNLGDLMLTAGQIAAAIEALRHALLLDPDDAEAHYALADALDLAGDATLARRHWQCFLALAAGPTEQRGYAQSRLAAARP